MIGSKQDSLRFTAGLLLAVALAGSPVLAQDGQAKTRRQHVGTALCRNCHYRSPAAPRVNLTGNNQFDNWFERTEMFRWEQQDKHYQAYAVLLNKRSQAMGAVLGIKEIHKEHSCLACHTSYSKSGLVDLEKHGTAQDRQELRFGVSCEGCHGPAGGNSAMKLSGWRVRHFDEMHASKAEDEPRWRFLSPGVKLSRYGYWDVRSPVARAEICVSCHIGNAKAGRVLTHEMYAAGHPPLPGFEIESFTEQMPRHWTTIEEKKPAALRQAFLKQTEPPRRLLVCQAVRTWRLPADRRLPVPGRLLSARQARSSGHRSCWPGLPSPLLRPKRLPAASKHWPNWPTPPSGS